MRINKLALMLAAGLSFAPAADADMTRDQARPVMYRAVVDMVGGATSSQELWGYPRPDSRFVLDVYTNDDMAHTGLLAPNIGFDYLATGGPEPENRTGLKIPWGAEPWAAYFNLPSLPDSATVYHAVQDSLAGLLTSVEGLPVQGRPPPLTNSPNPFSGYTSIKFSLREGREDLEVYDIDGRAVKTLITGPISPGEYNMGWDGTDNNGNNLASGIYFCGFRDETERSKLVLIR